MDAEVKGDDYTEDEAKQAKILVENLDPLVKNPGWIYFMAMLEKQINVRRGRMPEASDSIGAVFKNEFQNGEIAGIMLARSLAPGALGAAVELLTELKEDEEATKEGNADVE